MKKAGATKEETDYFYPKGEFRIARKHSHHGSAYSDGKRGSVTELTINLNEPRESEDM